MTRDNSILAENISAKHFTLGPLDGRYSQIGEKLAPYFSEYALVKNRCTSEDITNPSYANMISTAISKDSALSLLLYSYIS